MLQWRALSAHPIIRQSGCVSFPNFISARLFCGAFISDFQKSAITSKAWPLPLRGAFLIPPALLVATDFVADANE